MTKTNAEIREFQSKCRAFACKRRRPEIADDFAQDAAIAWLRTDYHNLEHHLSDFLRREYGDFRSHTGRARSRAVHSMKGLDSPIGETTLTLAETLPDQVDDREDFDEKISTLTAVLDLRDSVIAGLLIQGSTELEIADMLGVSESRISQLKKRITAVGTSIATLENVYDLYTDDKEYSKLEINWITL